FHGRLDELHIWTYAREIDLMRDKMHSTYLNWTNLTGAYNFNQLAGVTLPDTDAPAENGTNINMDNSNWLTSYVPMGNSTSRNTRNQRGIWQTTGTNDALDSDGFYLSVNVPLTETNYATYGHDNDLFLNAVVNTDLPVGVQKRYKEVWYIDEQGAVTANLTFDLNKIWGPAITASQAANYVLLYRNGINGAFSVFPSVASLTSSTKITFNNIALQDGYFTLGTSDEINSPLEAALVVGQSYFGANNYVEYIPGNLPIIIGAPHAGSLIPAHLPTILERLTDGGTYQASLMVRDSIMLATNGCQAHVIINHLHPKLFVCTGEMVEASGLHPEVNQAWFDFNNFIEIAKTKANDGWGKGHYFEMHTTARPRNQIGLGLDTNDLSQPDATIATMANQSTVKHLCTTGGANFLEVVKGDTCLGSLLEAKGWNSSPSYADPQPAAPFFYAGKNTWRHGSNAFGVIDATHIESSGAYINSNANRANYSGDVAQAMLTFMETFYDVNFSCAPLPIDLLNFRAYLLEPQNAIRLAWTTVSEINNSHFIVEKSYNSQDWTKLGLVYSQGNTTEQKQYALIDNDLAADAIHYYRLKQVDIEGKFTYSPIQSVKLGNASPQKVEIFPNPIVAGDNINFTHQDQIERISLYSLAGFEIATENNKQIYSHLPCGIYLLKIKLVSGGVETKKLVIK
ncbi:MAG: T9SS type A sorting domain-containing protein, partial [Bacteroidia bacterium]